ncbi:DUF1707 domain-containing protein [Actinoplanes sp. NPDC026623]|uniref:DUF1707 SHOCT-like domain-containing protein n=1 Tax=Actinoplanes sp. NPDC026623 TaxID=3155610 RepID=UPI0033DD49D9
MGRDEMRAADADRQAVADQLRAALDEGRLDLHEYDERLQQTYAAKTYGDLRPLLDDLPSAAVPGAVAVPAAGPVVPGTNAELTRRWMLMVWSGWVSTVGITSMIWLISCVASAELIYFWPVWVAGPWGAVLVFVTVAGLVNGEPRKQAEKQARKEQAKQLKRERRAIEAETASPGEVPLSEAKRDKKTG